MSVMVLLLVCMIYENQDDDSFKNSGIQESDTFYIYMRNTLNSILYWPNSVQKFKNSGIEEFRNLRIQPNAVLMLAQHLQCKYSI